MINNESVKRYLEQTESKKKDDFKNYLEDRNNSKYSDYLRALEQCDEFNVVLRSKGFDNFWKIRSYNSFEEVFNLSKDESWARQDKRNNNTYHWNGKVLNCNGTLKASLTRFSEMLKEISQNSLPLQRILYGSPGTGKSFSVKKEIAAHQKTTPDKINMEADNIFRTTFHPDYDYAQFVGCYKPVKKGFNMLAGENLTEEQLLQKFIDSANGDDKKANFLYEALVHQADMKHLGIDEKSLDSKLKNKGFENCTYSGECQVMAKIYGWLIESGFVTENKITYEFTPQVFTNALVKAYETIDPVYLVIEEINRGNCAQIFGDIFQLLDRNGDGDSEYSISVDEDLKKYLEEKCPKALNNGKIKLPRNFNIIATMNTSDQSLFPMDSAFKRRWEWQYVPVDLSDEVDSSKFEITIDGSKYKWHNFLRAVNVKIKDVTKSEDKQMGNFFIKKSVDAKEFCNKVMFYLWNDISKDYYESNDSLFQYKTGDGTKHFSFNELFGTKQFELLKGFMSFVGCEVSNSAEPEETTVSEEPQKEEDNN